MDHIEDLGTNEVLRVIRALDEPTRLELFYIIEDNRSIAFRELVKTANESVEVVGVAARVEPISEELIAFHVGLLKASGLVEYSESMIGNPRLSFSLTPLGKEVIGWLNRILDTMAVR